MGSEMCIRDRYYVVRTVRMSSSYCNDTAVVQRALAYQTLCTYRYVNTGRYTATGGLVSTLPTDDTLVTIRKKVINRIVCLADGNEIPDILYITRPNNGAHI